jgi:predicted RNA-binding Zn-ribbon protein involved in translation (DUF1610 family)
MAPPERTLRTCRLCWQPIPWAAEHLEEGELHVFFRCPHCGAAFPIRHSDAARMRAHEAVDEDDPLP